MSLHRTIAISVIAVLGTSGCVLDRRGQLEHLLAQVGLPGAEAVTGSAQVVRIVLPEAARGEAGEALRAGAEEGGDEGGIHG